MPSGLTPTTKQSSRYWGLRNADQPFAAIADFQSPLLQGLACAALQPGLRSILVFDSSPAALRSAAAQWAEMLCITTGQNAVEPIYLGPIDAEETLWGNLALTQTGDTPKFSWKAGLLGGPDDNALRLIVIPDLTRLSLAAARACIALMGNEVAQLERHGQQASWRSRICWLAGCDRSQVKFLSPHLLDRFALRLTGQDLPTVDRAELLRDWFTSLTEPPAASMLSQEWRDRLQSAQRQKSSIAPAAYERGLAYIAETSGQGMRRELALLRLAQAQTQLAELDEVTIEQVDQAAQLIGLKLLAPVERPAPSRPPEAPIAAPEPKTQPELSPSIDPPEWPTEKSAVYQPDSTTDFPTAPVELGRSQDPYPEDHTPTEREAASLRLPPRRFRSATVGRGTIVGVEPTTIPQDIAWVSTLLEAAKYQGFRQQRDASRLVLQSSDLRRYRRAAVPEQLLMLVLDHTCLRDCQWQAALLPYLQWAYVERASVCLVQVGAAGRELQAEKVSAQSVLVPRIRSGLERGPGIATPLAHGLDLALQTLRHALQHGRSTVHQAVLVVVSDGRGNVPLAASRTNQKPTHPVKRQGIEDALEVAGQIRSLKQVEAVVLNPQPKHYADLPVKLALALGAKIEAIPVVHAWEVDEP
jgi:magnesium chelatase subunit D